MLKFPSKGFTLAELLIALAILGVIATFTIPKVLQSQQDGKYKAVGKELLATMSGAYQAYRLNNTSGNNTGIGDLTPFMNYIKVNTSGSIDVIYGATGTQSCSTFQARCLLFANGAALLYWDIDKFGGTATTNGLVFYIDPDGLPNDSANATGNAKSLAAYLYYDGKIKTISECDPATTYNNGSAQTPCMGGPWPANSPPWFSWN